MSANSNGALAPRSTGGLAAPAGRGGGSLVAPSGTGAVGVVALSLARMSVLLDQAYKAMKIHADVGADLLREATNTDDMVQYLTASFGERISIDEVRVIANMLIQISEGSLELLARALENVRLALASNIQVQRAQEGVHATGADGGYIDSQRRVG